MSNIETSQKKGFNADWAIEGILRNYPSINAKGITLFSPIYYPIADIEIDFEEKAFEDFETVQITVLKLINLGHKSADVIADLMGLTAFYVQRIIKLLLGFGHIDENLNMTQLGKESIIQGKKITLFKGAQRFQLDPLGLNLIRLDKTVTRTSIINKEEISNGVLIFDFADSVSKDSIINELQSENFRRIMASRSKILNVNISHINNIRCLDIKYVQAYVLVLQGHEPIIFSQREDFTKNRKQRFNWLPFAAISKSTKDLLGIEDLAIYPQEHSEQINAWVKMIINESQTEKTKESLRSVMDGVIGKEELGLVPEHLKIDYSSGFIAITSKAAFSKVNFKTVSLLKTLADNGVNLLTNKNLRGAIIKMFVTDSEVLHSLNKLNKILEKQGSDDIPTNIRIFIKKIENNNNIPENANIIDIINQFEI